MQDGLESVIGQATVFEYELGEAKIYAQQVCDGVNSVAIQGNQGEV